jgi:1,4-dihydroxy-2-naphthoate octaprenyltransferase
MIKQATSPLEPRFEELAGDAPGRRARRLFLATRPKFLTASVLPVVVGTAWGAAVSGTFSLAVALLALVATALVHAASNVLNDVGDDTTGTDRVNLERIYPYTGGSRFIQNQIMSSAEMNRWGIGLLAAASVFGLWLAYLRGPMVLLFGLAGIAIAVLYSLPRVQLAGRGLGEFCICVAFGLLPVCGAAWLQSGLVDWPTVLVALPTGLWVTLILLINSVPDRKADGASGKRTMVVRLGPDGSRKLYQALHVVAFACLLVLAFTQAMPWWIGVGGLLLMLGGFKASGGIRDEFDRAALTKSIEMTLGLQVAGSVLLIAGALLAA